MPRQFPASQPPTRALRLRARGFVSPSWLTGKEGSRNGIKGKVQLGCGYLQMEDSPSKWCLLSSLLCPCLLSLFPESTKRSKGRGERGREEEREGEWERGKGRKGERERLILRFSVWLERKISSREEVSFLREPWNLTEGKKRKKGRKNRMPKVDFLKTFLHGVSFC